MSRYRPSTSYGQRIKPLCAGIYRISWTVDFYYRGSRLRHPRSFERETDEAGARRFAKRWELNMPEVTP